MTTFNPSMTCPISKHSKERPQAIAIRYRETRITFSELENYTNNLCHFFLERGLLPGERIAVVSENRPSLVPIIFALNRIGVSALLLSLQLTAEDWSEQLLMGRAKFIIGESAQLSKIKDLDIESLELESLEETIFDTIKSNPVTQANIDTSHESCVVFTSSKTGHKKGVVLSINNFYSSATASNRITNIKEGDAWAVSLPLYHVGGLGILYRTILAGASSYFIESFSAKSIVPLIQSNEITHISVVPTVLESLIDHAELISSDKSISSDQKYPLSGLKSVILAGAASSSLLINKIREKNIPVLSAWGMTETCAHCTCMSLDDSLDKITTVGRAFYHTKLAIVNDEGERLDIGQEGEIIVQGPTVCASYLDQNSPQPMIISGWLYTGDLGVIDEEGYLKIVGRKDDMFISGGENIHASEIEDVAIHYPDAKHVAVIPVAHPKWGQRPIIIVEPKESTNLNIDEMRVFLESKLAKIKVPDSIILIDELPRTGIGKVDYKALKQIYQ